MKRPWWRRFLVRPAVLFPLGAVVLVGMVLVALLWFQPLFLLDRVATRNPGVLFRVETDSMAIALTIDDVPDADLMPRVLETLARHEVRATFFVIGDKVPGNEDLIAAMHAAGHELGNHLAKDEASISLTDEEFVRQLREVEQLIGPLEGQKWCRPGSGWFTPGMVALARQEGYRFCLGSIYPLDNKLRKPGFLRRTVEERVFPGAVLILHAGGPERNYVVELLDGLLPAVKDMGYTFLTVTELSHLE